MSTEKIKLPTAVTIRDLAPSDGAKRIPAGTKVTLSWPNRDQPNRTHLTAPDGTALVCPTLALSLILKPRKYRRPTDQSVITWAIGGVAKSVLGHRVEPDGWDFQGSPSWCLVMGYV